MPEWGNPAGGDVGHSREGERTRGTETSQYPEERTSTETPVVVASEPGPGQCSCEIKTNDLERSAIVGESPVVIKQQETRVGRDT